ncbi:MAG: hypothetical protein QG658_593 [Patescibacteria group bacterium]|nr:hypothetical protein [Patescibacteria group bacterium]
MFHDFWNGLLNRAEFHAVNPAVFIAMYAITWPLVWYSWYLLVRSHKRADKSAFRQAIWFNRLVTFAPYIYVLAFGENFPVWLVPSSIIFMVVLSLVFKYRLGHGLLVRLADKVTHLRQKFVNIRQRFTRSPTDSQ